MKRVLEAYSWEEIEEYVGTLRPIAHSACAQLGAEAARATGSWSHEVEMSAGVPPLPTPPFPLAYFVASWVLHRRLSDRIADDLASWSPPVVVAADDDDGETMKCVVDGTTGPPELPPTRRG